MELKVWVEGIQRIVCGVTEKTTCQVSSHARVDIRVCHESSHAENCHPDLPSVAVRGRNEPPLVNNLLTFEQRQAHLARSARGKMTPGLAVILCR